VRVATVESTACANCGASLSGVYCATCGQKAAPLDPTVGDFLHDLVHEIAHVDGKIVRSVRLLLTKPGFLTREYVEGRRAPLRLAYRLACPGVPPRVRSAVASGCRQIADRQPRLRDCRGRGPRGHRVAGGLSPLRTVLYRCPCRIRQRTIAAAECDRDA
jgi:hypothetical protein